LNFHFTKTTVSSPIHALYYLKLVFFLDFEDGLRGAGVSFSADGHDRLVRCHGHALQDIVHLRELNFKEQPLPDLIVWPSCHEQVVAVVDLAKSNNVVVIPFGGGTSVSWAVQMPKHEERMLVVLDTSQMVMDVYTGMSY